MTSADPDQAGEMSANELEQADVGSCTALGLLALILNSAVDTGGSAGAVPQPPRAAVAG
ncbi:hypothetical protein [Streptomyces sp. 8N616]|uniref:hypothetical protein n=1 Tax=Streptomyces sp. 8N616 TaxID=3457414 RepID=UPI003FD5BE86